MSKLSELGLEIIERLSAIPEQTLEVRAAIAKAIILRTALQQVKEVEAVVDAPKKVTKKKATKKKGFKF